jgi:hypothetical protein
MKTLDSEQTLRVAANDPWNDTGIDVMRGEVLRFSASGNWWDAHYKAGPDGYDAPVWVRIFDRWRRCPDASWFELCGIIGRASSAAFVIGSRREISMPADGRLYLFANDANGFYWNNTGVLEVTVGRSQS